MTFARYTRVALRTDLPAHKLVRGDVAMVVEVHPGDADRETGYSLEVFDALGDTLAVVTVAESQIESLAHDEVPHVRKLDASG